ncbi:hypothetical protein GXW82_23575 [Streptacidiphilus sp. 4-A2]|nr:hypothetical protein [Streptacidiphilus sp. 4-A2]
MSNPNISLRAEQAVIGALLQEPAKREEIAYLRADRFTHPTYRALYSELIAGAAAKTAELPGQLADRLRIPGVSAAYLRDLAASGPPPADITVYARMVQEAYVRAQLAVQVDRIAVSAVQAGERSRVLTGWPRPSRARLLRRLPRCRWRVLRQRTGSPWRMPSTRCLWRVGPGRRSWSSPTSCRTATRWQKSRSGCLRTASSLVLAGRCTRQFSPSTSKASRSTS